MFQINALKNLNWRKVYVAAAFLFIIGVMTASQVVRSSADANGLVAAYSFNEGAGTTLTDLSGSNNNGTINGATWNTSGKYGKALSFDGINDLVSIADSNSLDLTTGMTLEAWVRPASVSSGTWRTTILKEQPNDFVYAMYAHNGSKPEGYIYTAGAEKNVTGPTALTVNTWAHLSLTYDGTTMRLYVNGTQVATRAQTGNIATSTGALKIGGNNIWSEWFSGLIDEVRIYNRALSSTEIQTDMNTPVEQAAPDTTAPTAPTNLSQTGSTFTSVTVGWTASTDNVGVTGYGLYKDTVASGSTTNTSSTFSNLACGTSYVIGVDAYDAATNRSSTSTVTANTTACDTTTPTVSVTAPTEGATVAGGSVALSANASDNVGVAGVQFKIDGNNVGSEDTVSPYTINWNSTGVSDGAHTVTAVARDTSNNTATSSTINVNVLNADATAPTVSLTAPSNGATVSGSSVNVAANASDNVGVVGVQFKLDGNNLNSEDTSSPYSTTWNTSGVSNGTHTLTAVARDAATNATTSTSVSVTVDNDTTAPTVNITAPTNGATVSGSNVTISANASDNIAVANVQFKVDGTNVGSADNSSPYSVSWNTTGLSNGSHAITAVATDTSTNSTTSSTVNVTVSNTSTIDPQKAYVKVAVGSGFVEASARQVVRTPGNQSANADTVYVIVADDTSDGDIHIYKGNTGGIPTSFAEQDAADRPTSGDPIGSPDSRLDRNGIIHMVYHDVNGTRLYYQTFSTVTNQWSTRTQLATNAGILDQFNDRTGNAALILDGNDVPHIVYITSNDNVVYLNKVGGSWSTPQTIASGTNPIHPALATDTSDVLQLTWADNTAPLGQGGGRNNPAATIKYAQRSTGGTWSSVETVESNNVENNIYLDQGPNIALKTNGTPYILFIDANEHMQIRYRTGVNSWSSDNPPTTSYGVAHTPTIHTEGDDIYAILGHDVNIDYGFMTKLAGGSWGTFQALDTTNNDGSASTRWDPVRQTNADVIDTIYFNEVSVQTYYMAFLPQGTGTPPPPDTTAPTVSLTAPSNGATVSGSSVTVSANASDNVGVAGVQFKLDGNNLNSEDTSSPFSTVWNASTASNGSHTLTAVARDAAGNTTTSSGITVIVDNSSPPTGQQILGNSALETNVDSVNSGQAEAFRFTASATGTLANLKFYLDSGSTSTTVVVGVYTNNNNHPGTLITQATKTGSTKGAWNTVNVSGGSLTSGQTYWIAILSQNGSGTLKFRDRVGGGASETNSVTGLTTLPTTWTTGSVFTDSNISAYGSN